jgi:sodium pump decarboxylase gamma subunit
MGQLLAQGLAFMLIGMLVVFAFLIMLVGSMNAAAAFFKRFAHLFPEQQQGSSNLKRISSDCADIAAVVAAVAAYSQRSAD